MDSAPLHLTATLEPAGPAGAFILSDAQVEQLGGGKRATVTVTVNGRTVRVRLAVMGGRNMIGLRRELRHELGIEPGDSVDVSIALGDAPREVDVPPDLAAALATESEARERFDALAFTTRKEFAAWVADA